MPKYWIEIWQQIEMWYGDPLKRETAEQLLVRLQSKRDAAIAERDKELKEAKLGF